MNVFDMSILQFVGTLSRRSHMWDTLIVWVLGNNFLKGGMMMALFWCAWASQDDERSRKRAGVPALEQLLLGFGLSIFAVAVARLLAWSLPFRERPLRNPSIPFQLPYSMDASLLENYSSFPSDHAVVFFCLAATLWMVSRRLGIVAWLYAFVVISLPRIYTGVHYPTDIIAGAALGCAMASLAKIGRLRTTLARPALRWMEKQPGPFYGFLFLATFELAELLITVRVIVQGVTNLLLAVMSHP